MADDQQKLRDEVAQEKFGKKFDDLDSDEKMSVGGTIGGKRGGQARKEQMGGDDPEKVHEAYSEMGKTGAKKGGYHLTIDVFQGRTCLRTTCVPHVTTGICTPCPFLGSNTCSRLDLG